MGERCNDNGQKEFKLVKQFNDNWPLFVVFGTNLEF